jgi:hypothetical protein
MFKVSIQLTDSLKNLLKETAKQLKGAAKRKFIAQTVAACCVCLSTVAVDHTRHRLNLIF